MDYINLLNQCPIAYVSGKWWTPEHCNRPSAIDRDGMTWELYDPWGEILAFSTREAALQARSAALAGYLR